MMMSGNKNDLLFRKLKDLEAQPSPMVWNEIERRLDQQKKRRLVLFLRVGAAASIALVAGLLFFFNNEVVHHLQGPLVVSAPTGESIEETDDLSRETPVHQEQNRELQALLPEQTEVDGTVMNEPHVSQNQLFSDAGTRSTVVPSDDVSEVGPLEDLQPTMAKMRPLVLSGIAKNLSVRPPEKLYANQSVFDNFAIALPEENNDKSKTMQVLVGGDYSPTYSFRSVSGSAPSRFNESGLNASGGGLTLAMHVGSRWQIETGVRYAAMGQEVATEARTERVFSFADESMSGNNYSNSITEISLDNSLGRVNYDLSPVKVDEPLGFKVADNEFIELKPSFMEDSDIPVLEQSLGYMQIPVTVRYLLFPDKRLGVSLSGGFSTNWLIRNNAYLKRPGQKQKIGETEGLRDMGISTHAGIALSVPVFKGLRLRMEPRIDYFIFDIGEDSPGSFRPYSLGVFTGLFYEW
ncbi:hypothetical protein ACT29H_00365 [Thermophagus sp. OGC60D27]|uniref:hypothetical protein n=1 Tax=Thermophagus sp. OGC60D27 TaxID=3458415 RepID=UPI0040377A7E